MTEFKISGPSCRIRQSPSDRQSRLLLGAGTLIVCIAGILALASAIECHAVATQSSPDISIAPSLLYGVVLWLWWAEIAQILWRTSRKWPVILNLSARSVALQIVTGVAIASLHLAALLWTVRLMVRVWPELEKAGYGSLTFFNLGRFGIDFLLYVLLWTACVVINMQLASQRDAVHALELRQQLSEAHLRALQMQLEPHFLFIVIR
jgi:sensor histidine kinase YesM